jgi:hypothetical protein
MWHFQVVPKPTMHAKCMLQLFFFMEKALFKTYSNVFQKRYTGKFSDILHQILKFLRCIQHVIEKYEGATVMA